MKKTLYICILLTILLNIHLIARLPYNIHEGLYAQAPWAENYKNLNLEPWVFLDFNTSMELSKYPQSIEMTSQVTGIDGNLLLHFLRGLYNKNNLSNIFPSKELKIPKIIHQIWLGSPLPECFKELMQSWINAHLDGWQYMLWTDKEAAEIELYNREFYDQVENPGVKSDLLKMEVIYQYGGVYIDTDFECLRPLDILHYTYDFYIGIQPLDSQFLQLGFGIFGARSGHPILRHCIETIKNDWHEKGAPKKTGPVHLTKSFYAVAETEGMTDIAFPASYFYPLSCMQKTAEREHWLSQGSFGIHWWAKSWMPSFYRPKEFKDIANEKTAKSWND